MKKLILTVIIAISSITIFAQPLPPTGANHGNHGNQPGNGAPLDGGLSVLILLGAAYGGKKMYSFKKAEPVKE
jgi:hypothetical protein